MLETFKLKAPNENLVSRLTTKEDVPYKLLKLMLMKNRFGLLLNSSDEFNTNKKP